MPEVSSSSIFQLHPFMITWWYNNSYRDADQIALLIEPKSGFTKKLQDHKNSGPLLAWIDGPYGQQKEISDYSSVVMLATEMSIAAQMPYLKELVNGYQKCNVRTRRISLIWQLDRENNQDWVQKWMDDLLAVDKGSYVS
jgi:predicted ferric reductase